MPYVKNSETAVQMKCNHVNNSKDSILKEVYKKLYIYIVQCYYEN